MALMQVSFFSDVLGLSTSMDVIVPQPTTRQIGLAGAAAAGPYKVLYLLHGLSDDHTTWQRRSAIERYVSPLPLVVVMPAVGRSWYTDMVRGMPYYTFMTEELPALCAAWFPISSAREDTSVAGLSMGGYGAFKLALSRPDRYGAAASLSGVLDVAARLAHDGRGGEWTNVFGDLTTLAGSPHDLLHLAGQVAAGEAPRPALYAWCGTEDALYSDNVTFRAHCAKLGLDLAYSEGPGDHTWDRWDDQIRRVLQWLGFDPAR